MNLAGMIFRRHLPSFNPLYSWHLEWLFDDEHCMPHFEDFSDPSKALDAMVEIWNSPRTIVHLSISRRNA